MANICDFKMILVGTQENIETFLNELNGKSEISIGYGVKGLEYEIDILDDNLYRCELTGGVNWSIKYALIDNADNVSSFSLFEACKRLNLDMECYSDEGGNCFQEHYLFQDGVLCEDECLDYEKEYDEEVDEHTIVGGFGEWDFSI